MINRLIDKFPKTLMVAVGCIAAQFLQDFLGEPIGYHPSRRPFVLAVMVVIVALVAWGEHSETQ